MSWFLLLLLALVACLCFFASDPLDPPSKDKKSRPVLDAIHERTTGNLRMRVNDGREIGATRSAAVEIAISNIGVVLFNPKTMVSTRILYKYPHDVSCEFAASFFGHAVQHVNLSIFDQALIKP